MHTQKIRRASIVLLMAIGLVMLLPACDGKADERAATQKAWDDIGMITSEANRIALKTMDASRRLGTPDEAYMVESTVTPTGTLALTSQPAGPITYPGTAAIQWETCEIAGSGWLYLNPDHTFRIVMLQPDLNGNCKSAGNAKVEWDFGGTTNAGTLTFTTCNDQSELRSEGNGSYTDKEATASATCVDSHNGDVMVKMDMKFSR